MWLWFCRAVHDIFIYCLLSHSSLASLHGMIAVQSIPAANDISSICPTLPHRMSSDMSLLRVLWLPLHRHWSDRTWRMSGYGWASASPQEHCVDVLFHYRPAVRYSKSVCYSFVFIAQFPPWFLHVHLYRPVLKDLGCSGKERVYWSLFSYSAWWLQKTVGHNKGCLAVCGNYSDNGWCRDVYALQRCSQEHV